MYSKKQKAAIEERIGRGRAYAHGLAGHCIDYAPESADYSSYSAGLAARKDDLARNEMTDFSSFDDFPKVVAKCALFGVLIGVNGYYVPALAIGILGFLVAILVVVAEKLADMAEMLADSPAPQRRSWEDWAG